MALRILWTIGHSNRQIDGLTDLLLAERIEAVADVRRFPGSRRCPHFNREALDAALQAMGLVYRHFPELGGRRTNRAESSPNTAWRVEAFSAYADYMLSGEFAGAFADLVEFALWKRTAIMCAEALPWRCHRRLIADQFIAIGWQVFDVVGPRNTKEYALPDFAKVVDGHVIYPGETLF